LEAKRLLGNSIVKIEKEELEIERVAPLVTSGMDIE
jgi:hypothetical protein